jgi:ketosteroid isomerase-like protein
MDASAEALRKFLIKDELTTLLHEYCAGLDLMDLDQAVAIFTDDCVVEYGPGEGMSSRGAATLRKDLERLWRYRRSSHHLSNIRITVVDDRNAHGVSSIIAWHERGDGEEAIIYGQYHDTFVRTDAGWRIAFRKQLMAGNSPGFTATIYPLERRPAPEGWTAPVIS